MAASVNPKRSYDSPRRREAAAATRVEILGAAERLFERDGYAGTTIAAVAVEARVATKTIYLAFETKSGLLRALWNHRLRGGSEEVPIAQHQWYREVLDEADPVRKLKLNARNSRAGKERVGRLAEVIRSAAPLEPEIAALWARIGSDYHANQRAVVEGLRDMRKLRPDLDVDRATDILWTINHPSTWQMLVAERGWTADQYEQWCAESACAQLLSPDAAGEQRPRPRGSAR